MNIKLNFGKTHIPTTIPNQFIEVNIHLKDATYRHGKGYVMRLDVVKVIPTEDHRISMVEYCPTDGVWCWLSEVARASKRQAEYAVNRANELFDWLLGKLKEKNEGLQLAEEVK